MNDVTLENSTLRKVAWRLVPLICVCFLLNIIDRTNVGFARLRMQDDLGLSEQMFNLGFGMFYVGYLLFEVPSNLLMRRFGARRWIARIMISWGIVSAATMFAWDQWSFYGLRILLGIAEAGFFPGIILRRWSITEFTSCSRRTFLIEQRVKWRSNAWPASGRWSLTPTR